MRQIDQLYYFETILPSSLIVSQFDLIILSQSFPFKWNYIEVVDYFKVFDLLVLLFLLLPTTKILERCSARLGRVEKNWSNQSKFCYTFFFPSLFQATSSPLLCTQQCISKRKGKCTLRNKVDETAKEKKMSLIVQVRAW